VDLAPMLAEYYVARGWDADGRPRAAKLEQLGLSAAVAASARAAHAPGAAA